MAADKYILASKFAEELDTIPVELKRIGHTYKHQKLISLNSAIDLLAEAPAADVRPVAEISNAVDEVLDFLNDNSNCMPYHIYSALFDLVSGICPNCGRT